MRAHSVVGIAASPFTGSQQTQEWPGNWWEADVTLPPMTRSDAEAWVTFLIGRHGMSRKFLMGDPSAKTPRGAATGTPVVDGAGQAGGIIAIRGYTPSVANIQREGDYIQIGSRLYKILEAEDSNVLGKATFDIFPNLRESPGDGDAVITTNCKGTFRLASNDTEWDVDSASIYGLSFKALEAF
jgi:hypothetical protein